MAEALPPGRHPSTEAELQAIVARLAALTSEEPSQMATELDAIRAHLRLLAIDNEEVGRFLGERLGLREAPTLEG
jgi:hypothetical protein